MQAYIKNNALIICDLLENEESSMSNFVNNIITNGVKIDSIHNIEGNISGVKISPSNIERRN